MDTRQIVEAAVDPAIATNARNKIICWNQEAKQLFGVGGSRNNHSSFVEALDPRDISGNYYNHDTSIFEQMILRGERIQSFELMVRDASGELIRVKTSVVAVLGSRDPDDWHYAYVMAPVRRRRRADEAIERLLHDPHSAAPVFFPESEVVDPEQMPRELTGRQVEILRLLAKGTPVKEIAEQLCVSTNTVRSHVRNILLRLRVHSQVEAVSLALRHHLI